MLLIKYLYPDYSLTNLRVFWIESFSIEIKYTPEGRLSVLKFTVLDVAS